MKLPVVPLTSSSLVSPKRRQSGRQSETQSEARRKYVIAGSVGRTAMLATAFWLLFQPAVPSAQQSGTSTTTSGTAGYQADQDSHAASTRPESGAVIEKNVLIPMRDGIAMAADVYRPATNGMASPGEFPVIVFRTPYNKDGFQRIGVFFASHGFVAVAEDCRGRFASGGKFYLLVNEGPDGYDTIEWAARQPWSNGKIGTVGGSYSGWVQYAEAMLSPPHLVAMFPIVAWDDFYKYAFTGGIPSMNRSQWVLYMAAASQEAQQLPSVRDKLSETVKNPDAWLSLPPTERGKIFLPLPQYSKMFRDLYGHPRFDSYWQQPALFAAGYYGQFKDVPMYFISGWYDGTAGGVIHNDVELSALQQSPKRLMIGPWPHATGDSTCGEAYFGSSAAVDEQALQLDWFNHWLKAEPYKIIGGAPVRIFEMGGGVQDTVPAGKVDAGGRWISIATWPPPTVANNLYLDETGTLRDSPPQTSGSSSFVDDPANPVPTRGGYFQGDCVQNQAEVEKRADILKFTTAALKTPISIMGTVEVHLLASSTAPDTDFIAKLVDVYPNGYSMIVAEGQLRVSYRNGPDQLSLVTPGDIYALNFSLGPTSNLFAPGHRIRLDISSTDFPRLEPNPNTAAAPGEWSTTAIARNAIYSGGPYSSYLVLPVLTDHSLAPESDTAGGGK